LIAFGPEDLARAEAENRESVGKSIYPILERFAADCDGEVYLDLRFFPEVFWPRQSPAFISAATYPQ